MSQTLRTLFQPLNLAALATWLAVGLALPAAAATSSALIWILMVLFLVGFTGGQFLGPRQRGVRAAFHAAQAAIALALVWLAPNSGTAPVLLVILMVQLARAWSAWTTLGVALVLNLVLYLLLRNAGVSGAGVFTLIFVGFEAFAALIAHYANSAEQARDRLARVNADLLATRALLADSARVGERLRVARELHDVAGHKLTAIRINLRAMLADPVLADRPDVRLVEQLSAELLAEIRSVVQAMRDTTGLDLETALRALAAPFPRPQMVLEVGADVHVDDPVVAEALLRIVQEALTNTARHADAGQLRVRLARSGDGLSLVIEDDGRLSGPLHEGNGLRGMRERIAALGGSFVLDRTSRGALRIDASLPA